MKNNNNNLNIYEVINDIQNIDLNALISIGGDINKYVPQNRILELYLGANLGNLDSKFVGDYLKTFITATSATKVDKEKAEFAIRSSNKAKKAHICINEQWYKISTYSNTITADSTAKRDYDKLVAVACLGAATQFISNVHNFTKPSATYPNGNMKYDLVNCNIGLGLPIKEFMIESNRDKVQNNFDNKVFKISYMDRDFILKFDLADILAEGYAYYQYLYDELNLDDYTRVFLLDAGSKSWDFCEIIEEAPERYDSIMNAGTITLIQKIKDKISKTEEYVTDDLVDIMLRNGSVAIGEHTYNRTDYEEDIKEYALTQLADLDRKLNNTISLNNIVVLIGGGAYLIEKYAKEYFKTKVIMVKDPVFANAKAYHLAALATAE